MLLVPPLTFMYDLLSNYPVTSYHQLFYVFYLTRNGDLWTFYKSGTKVFMTYSTQFMNQKKIETRYVLEGEFYVFSYFQCFFSAANLLPLRDSAHAWSIFGANIS